MPLTDGVNDIVRFWFAPGAIVRGNCEEGITKSVLSGVAAVTTRLPADVPPVFDNCTVLVEVVPLATGPKPNGEGVIVKMGAAEVLDPASKSAFTACALVRVKTQLPVPLHAPDQPLNVFPLDATALKVTTVPSLKFDAHCVGQLMPAGLLVIEPPPVAPLTLAFNGSTATKFAVSV